MMTSPQAGMSGLVSSPEANTPLARTALTPVISGPNFSGAEDERHDEADQGEGLGKCEAQEQVGTGQAGGLWLTRGRVDVRGEGQADGDRRPDGREAGADRAEDSARASAGGEYHLSWCPFVMGLVVARVRVTATRTAGG